MFKSNLFKILLVATIFSNFFHWRFFDGFMIALAVALITLHPFSKDELKYSFRNSKWPHIALLGLLCVIAIGYQLVGTPDEFFNFRWILGFYLIYLSAQKIGLRESSSLKSIFVAVAAAVVVSIGYNLYMSRGISLVFNQDHRFQGFYTNSNVYGMAAGLCIAFCVGWLSSNIYFKKPISIWNIIALTLLAATTYLTYSRSAWMSIVAALIVMVCFLMKDRRILFAAATAVVILGLMFSFNIFQFRDRITYTKDMSTTSSNAIRLEIWKANLAMFSESPYFGVGYWRNTQLLSKYAKNLPVEDQKAHAHNQYLQFLSGSGVLGLGFYLALCLWGLIYFFNTFRTTNQHLVKQLALCGLLVLVTYLVESLTDSPLDSREVRNFLMLTLGTILGSIVSVKNASKFEV